jgi:hypothetical protein
VQEPLDLGLVLLEFMHAHVLACIPYELLLTSYPPFLFVGAQYCPPQLGELEPQDL